MSESIEILNIRLADHFGVDTISGQPIFRIVWSDDQTEKRLMDVTDSGVQLLYPEIREVKKYAYLEHLYILEQLVMVPDVNQSELPVRQSYEPLWAYRDANNMPLPPIWNATKFIIDTMHAVMGKSSLVRYVEPEDDKEDRVRKIQEELFGNDTETGDALHYKEGIVVPNNYKKNEVN